MKYIIVFGFMFFAISCKEREKPVVQKEDTYYTCSMHPQIMQNGPGKCPICGMELISVHKEHGQTEEEVVLSDQQVQLGNIRLDTIGKSVMGNKTVLTATLATDESKTVVINARMAGRIEKLYFKTTGNYLHRGDRLYDLYSEELNNAKQEFLLALEKQKILDNSIIDFKQLVESSRNKLLLWGMTENQVAELAKTKYNSPLTTFYSPSDGYITILESHEGDYVAEGTVILRLANLSTIWAEAQVYTSQLSDIDPLGSATVQLPGISKEMKGKIEFVNPEINPATRINLIRVTVQNPAGMLKPGMPAYVVLKNRQSNTLTLNSGAIIRNEKGSLVWVSTGRNRFISVMVKTGLEDGERVEILSGLSPGDRVVTSGAYLLNSEYIIKHGKQPMAGHDMSNM
jgi:membrane fusion protein, copper/silver efflux system